MDAQRDIIAIDDVVAIIRLILDTQTTDQCYNVASGVSVPIEKLIDHLEARLNTHVLRKRIQRGDDYQVNIDKLKRDIDLSPFDFPSDYYKTVIDRYYFRRMEKTFADVV